MKKWGGLILSLIIASGSTFLIFSFNTAPAQAGVSVSATVSICGNGTVEGDEQCDGADLNGETCSSRGYDSGTLSCNANCTFNVSSCSNDEAPSGGGGGGGGGYYIPPTATAVILQGKAYPGSKITVLIDGSVATVITANSSASFKTELTTLTAGTYTFGLWAEDSRGNKSITFSFTITVAKDMTTTVSNIFLPPTIELDRVNLSRGEILNISGQTAPESTVSIYVESEQEIVKEVVATETGDWKQSLSTTLLQEGLHAVRAKAEDQAGLLSSFSKLLSFAIGKYSVTEIVSKADFNNDGKTNLVDFSMMLYWWGKYNPTVDQNQDGIINLPDFSILMYHWTG